MLLCCPQYQTLAWKYVVQVQQHCHTSTCKRAGAQCRFKYPRPLSDRTRLLNPGESRGRRDLRRCDFYLTERRAGEERVVPYNRQVLLAWGANMDIQLVGSQHATNVYVGGYMTKCETEGLSARIDEALAKLPATSSARKRLFKIGMACLAAREVSQQEQLYLIAGLPLRSCSRQVESLCVSYPEKRAHLVSTAAMLSASRAEYGRDHAEGNEDDEENDPDDVGIDGRHDRGAGACQLQLNKFDFYRHRPEELEHLTLAPYIRYIYICLTDHYIGTASQQSVACCCFVKLCMHASV